MLAPDSPVTRLILTVVLAALLGLLVLRTIRKDRREYRRFKNYTDTDDRQRILRKWLLESFAMLGGSAAVILILAWPFVPRMLDQANGYPVLRELHDFASGGGGIWSVIALVAIVVVAIGLVLVVVLLRNTDEVPTIGDISALLPRNRQELRYGAALSINAGIVEELLFRLAVPALLYAVVGNALVAIVASVVLFALLHLYQGLPGILGALVIGVLLMLVYLATGSILWPILAHALFDLRSLVLIPVVVYRVHRRSGDEPPAAEPGEAESPDIESPDVESPDVESPGVEPPVAPTTELQHDTEPAA